MNGFWSASISDARYALRSLLRSPVLTLVAVATLAIGSGAATATFAVVKSVLLDPLPYPKADELVALWHEAPGAGLPLEDASSLMSAGSMYLTYAEENRVFENIGLWTPGVATITGNGEPEEVPRVAVTLGVLEALGVRPLLGRWFDASDVAEGRRVVMLGHGYWQRRFGGDPAVIGRTLIVNASPAEIVGVMPDGFRIAGTNADLLMGPMRFAPSETYLVPFAYFGIARLKPGMTLEDANADIARMIPIWLASWPAPPGTDASIYADVWRIGPALRPLKRDVVGPVGDLLWFVMATIGVVLTIACANVANLMLIRGEARQHELAIRAVLGARVGRLGRALMLEGVIVGLAGGLVGLALANGALRLLLAFGPTNLPRLAEIALDANVAAASLGVATFAGLLVGLGPAVRAATARVAEGLHSRGRTSSEGAGPQRLRQSLLIAQIALGAVVLVSAGLLLRTVGAMRTVAPGFDGAEQVQTLRISIRDSQIREPQRVARRQQEIVEALAALPGASAVGFASSVPMDGFNRLGDGIVIEGRPEGPGPAAAVRRFKYVSPRFFDAAGIRIVSGRDLTWNDLYEGRSVVVVAENLARELWGAPASALGKRIRIVNDERWHEIVGVVADVREDGLREAAPSIVYWPSLNGDFSVIRSVIFAVRTPLAGTEAMMRQVQEAVWSVDPNLPVTWVRTLRDIYDQHLSRLTFTLGTLMVAAAASLVLCVVGLYGVLSYAVSLHRRDIAIRLALGARQREILGQYVRQGVVLAALGVASGLLAAAGVTGLMSALLYDVGPVDPLTYGLVAAGLIGVATLASYLPARRASAVDPAESLAAE